MSALSSLLGATLDGCPCGRTHRVALADVRLGAGALASVPDLVAAHTPRGPLLLVADPDTYDAAGERVAALLRAAGRTVALALTPRAPHADDRAIAALTPALACGPARVVAVGAGTINDLGKVLAREAGVPLLTVGTAASMNGYASAIAALTIDGLKVTRPAPAADLLVLDLDVLARAPLRLARAGLGDLCSKPVSGADWVLAHHLVDEALCPTALALADDAVARARAQAAGIGAAEPGALAALVEALVLSGLSMAIAGASSPASGGEHLFSHDLDIGAAALGRAPFLHGEQVAVGTLASLALYARLLAGDALAAGGPAPPDDDDDAIRAGHAHLDSRALEAVLREARAKRARRPGREERRARLARDGARIRAALEAQLAGAAGLAGDLARAGVPCTLGEIGVDRARGAHVLRTARHIRDRYTVLDLAADLGVLGRYADDIATEL